MIPVEIKCRDFGDHSVPDCLGTPDERYTMDFSDIGEDPIYWCSVCGPRAHSLQRTLEAGFAAYGDVFAARLREAIDKAEAEERVKKS